MGEPIPFWMVKGEGPANMIHTTRHGAEAEARRLARANPDRHFYVMQAVACHRKVDVERIELSQIAEIIADEELPF